MAAVFSLLFTGILCVVLYAVFLAVWVGVLFVFRARHKVLYSLLSLPVFVVLLVSCFFWLTRPSAVFQDSFGFRPTPDVTGLQSSQWILGDCGIIYLHFKANPATVQRIVSKGLLPVGPTTANPMSNNDTPPNWWQPPNNSVQEFTGNISSGSFAYQDDYLVYDPATGDVWYRFIGID